MELKLGSNGPEVLRFYDFMQKYAKSYAFLLGKRDGYYGKDEHAFTCELQRRLKIVIDGKFGDRTASACGYRWTGTTNPPVVVPRRKIWYYSNPGSGANEFVGPSFDLGERAKDILKINHQPVRSAIGGYLGVMGGDSKTSYIEVTFDQYKSIEWLLDNNPDIEDPELELWFSGYSQKADGLEDALEILFGDGGFKIPATGEIVGPGKYRHLRDRINGVIQFGNPSTQRTGIARKIRPAWLVKKIRNINAKNDFYAVATDEIRPAFYAIIIQAETELPFFVHVLKIAVPVIMDWAAKLMPMFLPLLGGFGPMVQLALGSLQGLQGLGNNPLLGNLMGQAASADDEEVDRKLIEMLTLTGLIMNIGGLIQLVGALPGLQSHGSYHLPSPDFGGKSGVDVGYDIMAGFTR